jgi:DNA repair protein RecO (recombination protein O)
VLDKASQAEEAHPEIFELTFNYFKALQAAGTDSTGVIFWSALMKFLGLEGYAPNLDKCICCSKDIPGEKMMVSLSRGGLVCGNCVEPDEPVVLIARETLGLLRRMEAAPLTEMASMKVEKRMGKMAAEVILSLASYHLGLPRNLKSFKFLEELGK